ncbi:P-loop containing nucleoside triphosphate hydrolase protein [Ochromonadaceae sp. CCMP2298]|nr:P-loop containing nucleoside triphosphate hydrolase protein [Ochromonadaceae sp. CCMP2298]
MVERNGRMQPKHKQGSKHDEKLLFGKQTAATEVVEFGVIDDKIPVERSGPRSEEIAALASFSELEAVVPDFVSANIRLMKYEAPTPIQKHAIPLGLAGVDLMCCSQTGSGKTFSFMLPIVTVIQSRLYSSPPPDVQTEGIVQQLATLTVSPVPASPITGSSSCQSLVTSVTTSDRTDATDQSAGIEAMDKAEGNLPEAVGNGEGKGNSGDGEGQVVSGGDVRVDKGDGDGGSVNSDIVERVSVNQHGALPLAIVLAPTRELASQIHMDARRLSYKSDIKSVCVYGGSDLRQQLADLSVGCDLIVATPGRLNDLVERGCVSLQAVTFLVLDEADRMLDMGFEPQIRRIIQGSDMPPPGSRQTCMFSATFPEEIQRLAGDFLKDYVWVSVGRVGSAVDSIKQVVVQASSDPMHKLQLLLVALQATEGRTLVFVQKRRTASWLCECLRQAHAVQAEEIHGDRTQAQREHALKLFRDGTARILIATDVAARGLDVPAVTHVVQFDLPLSVEDFDVYVHRIGRTGRAGSSGLATAFFVSGREIGEGNGKIAPQILQLLNENTQEVPEWFTALDDHYPERTQRGPSFNRYNNKQLGQGGGGYQNKNEWRDMRHGGNGYQQGYANQPQRAFRTFQNGGNQYQGQYQGQGQEQGYDNRRSYAPAYREQGQGQERYAMQGQGQQQEGEYAPQQQQQQLGVQGLQNLQAQYEERDKGRYQAPAAFYNSYTGATPYVRMQAPQGMYGQQYGQQMYGQQHQQQQYTATAV